MTGHLLLAEEGGLVRLTLDRPAKVNAMTAAMMEEMAERLGALGQRAGLDLIAIAGCGPRGFCGGADVREFAADEAALRRQLLAFSALMLALERSAVPVAVLAHGRTLGAGAAMAALADLVLASEDISFGWPEIHLGLFPAVVAAVLRRRLPEALVHSLTLGGRLLSAAEAQAMGLVTEILPARGFAARAEERLAFHLARAPALAAARAGRPEAAALLERDLAAARALLLRQYAAPGVQLLLRRFLAPRPSPQDEGTQGGHA
ncbi:enoyl-CoA hydratase/isomerase family protein [Rubritepida flocculans]|uniref:enoyl-CoA hydratase/isomerase family protein n=1 Tax=Rubritepida flocculans TaxID=182403 RepID=UPI0003FF062B|nr:enoyl-CoA hydratase/isomerase family protein [Rubritepida flocculans]